jgi:hypothetical protein
MIIPPQQAYYILWHHWQTGTDLEFGGRIDGEENGCRVTVTGVYPETKSITIRVSQANRASHCTQRSISLAKARFSFTEFGMLRLDDYTPDGWRSVLYADLPGKATFFLAEIQERSLPSSDRAIEGGLALNR